MTEDHSGTRRRFLRTVATGATLASLGGVVEATDDPTFERTIRRAQRYKTDGVGAFHRVLRDAGLAVGARRSRYAFPAKRDDSPDGGGFGIRNYDSPSQLDVTTSIVADSCDPRQYYADLTWSYRPGDGGWFSDDDGEPPLDAAGLSYDDDWWELPSRNVDESTIVSGYVRYADGSYGGNGPGFEVDDHAISEEENNEGEPHYCGVFLRPLGDHDPDVRRVYGEYTHTWNEGEVKSVAVSFPKGLSVSVGSTTKKWKTDTEDGGEQLLIVSQADVSADCGDGDCGEVTESTKRTGSVADGGATRFTHEARTTGTCETTARLDGPSDADFDLYVTTDGRTPTPDDYDATSRSKDSTESVTLDADFDRLGLLVDAYSGGGDYVLTVTETGTGTRDDDGPDPRFANDDRVSVEGETAVRSSAGGATKRRLPDESSGYVRDGPTDADGRTWYDVAFNAGVRGWVDAGRLERAPHFESNTRVTTRSAVGVRTSPSTDAAVKSDLSSGSAGYVRRGPERSDGEAWYEVAFNAGVRGWLQSETLEVAPVE